MISTMMCQRCLFCSMSICTNGNWQNFQALDMPRRVRTGARLAAQDSTQSSSSVDILGQEC